MYYPQAILARGQNELNLKKLTF